MATEKKNVALYVVIAVLLFGLVLYFGLVRGYFSDVPEKEQQRLRELGERVPELKQVITEAEKDGKITQLEYWDIIDAYKEKQQDDFKDQQMK